MNVGDKVRILHDNAEGIVSKTLDNGLVEIEIEEGFHIPVRASEVVVVRSVQESDFVESKPTSQAKDEQKVPIVTARKGVFLAFLMVNDKQYSLYLINNTDYDLPFTLGIEKDKQYQGVFAGILRKKSHIKTTEVNLQNMDKWGIYIVQCLFFTKAIEPLKEAFMKRMRFRTSNFFKHKKTAPILDKEAYLFQLDQFDSIQNVSVAEEGKQDSKPALLDAEQIKAKMFDKNTETDAKKDQSYQKPPKLEVDLHIEELTEDYARLNSSEIIEIQLKEFEKQLDAALLAGMEHITFIHGLGNGTLRKELHTRLSKNTHIKFYEDAQKGKFGYGATKVTFA